MRATLALVTGLAGLIAFTGVGSADSLSNHDLAEDVATIIAGAEVCDLALSEAAVLAYIDERVDHTVMGFSDSLDQNLRLARFTAEKWSGLVRSAQCRAIENSARAQGFIE